MEFVKNRKRIEEILDVDESFADNTYLLDFNNMKITPIKEVAFSDILATISDKSGYFLVRDVK